MQVAPKRLILLNQSTGSLFLELSIGLASYYEDGAVLVSNGPFISARQEHAQKSLTVNWAPPYDRRTRLHRVLSWISYPLYITHYILFARRGDVILLASNPPLLAPWVWLLTRFRNVPYAVLVYDIHPNVLVQAGALKFDGLAARFWKSMNQLAYGKARVLITIGNRMAKAIERQVGHNGGKVRVIPPWVDVRHIKPISKDENPFFADYVPSNKTIILYSGNMGASHDIGSILEAISLLRDDIDLFFLLIGGGEQFADAQEFAKIHALDNLKVLPWQSADKVQFTIPLGDIALVALDIGMEDLMVPSKSFTYMAAGCALIAIANEPSELSDLLTAGDFGVLVAPRSPKALAQAIRVLANDERKLRGMRLEARRVAERFYSSEVGVRSFKDTLAEVGLLPVKSQSEK